MQNSTETGQVAGVASSSQLETTNLDKEFVESNLTVDKNLTEGNWKPWALRRRTTDLLAIKDAVALSLGVLPDNLELLSARTKPSLSKFYTRRKIVIEAVESRNIDLLKGDLLKDAPIDERLISFSGFVQYAVKHKLELSKNIIAIEKASRSSESKKGNANRRLRSANQDFIMTADGLQLTLGALMLVLAECVEKKQVPEKYQTGGKLNRSAIARKLVAVVESVIGDNSPVRGFSEVTVRQALRAALKRFPENMKLIQSIASDESNVERP